MDCGIWYSKNFLKFNEQGRISSICRNRLRHQKLVCCNEEEGKGRLLSLWFYDTFKSVLLCIRLPSILLCSLKEFLLERKKALLPLCFLTYLLYSWDVNSTCQVTIRLLKMAPFSVLHIRSIPCEDSILTRDTQCSYLWSLERSILF